MKHRFQLLAGRILLLFLALLHFAGVVAVAQSTYQPEIAPASDEARLAMAGFRIPEGINVELVAAEPLVANPVAFCIDAQGRIYVAETFRQSRGVEDNRGHMNWLEDDLSLQTVEDRLEMFRRYLGDAVEEYSREHDRIRLLEDTDDDRVADRSTVFADGFNDILDGTGAGVLARNGDVYYTCIPRLYRLRDDNGDGQADQREILHDGFGVRVAFRGHDLHGLIMGPDGRLYFSIGDRGYNVVTHEDVRLIRPDAGAVFRCNPDGSELEVFAYGLRNPQELAFDDYGNLFTVDNNSDSGDQARLTYIPQGGDIGWRMYYQYLPDRGPWNRERIWYPYRADDETARWQPACTIPAIANVSDGPSGLVHYPGIGLQERYQGHFFLADFRGSAANSGIRSFAVRPHGATFQIVDDHWFIESILATDLDFSADGSLYVSDWVDGWEGAGKGRIYRFFDPERTSGAVARNTARLMRDGFESLSVRELVALLSHADRRIRQEAQFKLAADAQVDALATLARSDAEQIPRLHAVWGLGQVARGIESVVQVLVELLRDSDAEVRAQTLRMLAEVQNPPDVQLLTERVLHGTPREQYYAALAVGQSGDAAGLDSLVSLLAANADEDPLLRHAAVTGLSRTADVPTLAGHATHPHRSVRLGALLALRRLEKPECALFLDDEDPAIVEEAARAIHDLAIHGAMPDLAALSQRGNLSDPLARRVLNANFRLGGEEHAAAIGRMAADGQLPVHLRTEAVNALLNWDQPPSLDRVTNEFRPLAPRPPDVAREAAGGIITELLASDIPEIRVPGMSLAAKYEFRDAGPRLFQIASDDGLSTAERLEALNALSSLNDDRADEAIDIALASGLPRLRAAARRLLSKSDPRRAIASIQGVLNDGAAAEQQSAIDVLADIEGDAAEQILHHWLERMIAASDDVPAEIQLDLIQAAEERGGDVLAGALARFEESLNPDNPLARYRVCQSGGDAARGREIFFGNAAASCRRCHVVNGEGSNVGPDLSGIGKDKDREYLLQSMVDPNAKIAKGFETVVFLMQDGRIQTGIVKEETDDVYTLMTSTGELIRVAKDSIDDRAAGRSGMPDDLVKQLSRSELRDLVEYLSTLQTPTTTTDE